MKLNEKEQGELMIIINDVRRKLKLNNKINMLYTRKRQIINYLELMNKDENNKKLMQEYNKLDMELKQLEFEAAYIISKSEKSNVIKLKKDLRKNNNADLLNENMYEQKFNELLKDSDYSKIIKKRNWIFNELRKINIQYSEVLYKLDISTAETDALRDYIMKKYS